MCSHILCARTCTINSMGIQVKILRPEKHLKTVMKRSATAILIILANGAETQFQTFVELLSHIFSARSSFTLLLFKNVWKKMGF